MGRRNDRTDEQKKYAKAVYDARRREELADKLKAEKAAYHQRTYNPEAAAKYRASRMHMHVAYCRQPEYRAKKQTYDRRHLAQKHYGDFADAALILLDLEREVIAQMPRTEIAAANGTLNKKLQRSRIYG